MEKILTKQEELQSILENVKTWKKTKEKAKIIKILEDKIWQISKQI